MKLLTGLLLKQVDRYRINLGRSDSEIKEMCSRIETELYGVLTEEEQHNFNINKALERINAAMGSVL